jgi:hypothetical protein
MSGTVPLAPTNHRHDADRLLRFPVLSRIEILHSLLEHFYDSYRNTTRARAQLADFIGDSEIACHHQGHIRGRLRYSMQPSDSHRHASAHARSSVHPIARSAEPGEDSSRCYLDNVAFVVTRP